MFQLIVEPLSDQCDGDRFQISMFVYRPLKKFRMSL